jgi:hypothetical protein
MEILLKSSDNVLSIENVQDDTTMNFLVLTLSLIIWILFQHDGGLLALLIGPLFLAVYHHFRNEQEESTDIEAS